MEGTEAPAPILWKALPERWLVPACIVVLLVPLCILIVPDHELPIMYTYAWLTHWVAMGFCVALSRRQPGSKILWLVFAAQFLSKGLGYMFLSFFHLGIARYTEAQALWLVNGFASLSLMLCLLAVTSARMKDPLPIRMLDGCMAVLLCALQFVGSYSHAAGYARNHMIVGFVALLFVCIAAVVAHWATATRLPSAFTFIAMTYLGVRVLQVFLMSIVNEVLLPHDLVGFEVLMGLPSIYFCWIANRALLRADDAGEVHVRRPVVHSVLPSIVALTGITLAPFSLSSHPVLATTAVFIIVACYMTRTHLLYRHLLRAQMALRTHAGRLEELANRDALTGIGNRRSLEDAAADLLTRKAALPAALVLLDVDDFKIVNDTFGHAAGDEVIRTVAQFLCEGVGDVAGSWCARLGGDEFVALLPSVDGYRAGDIAEQTRQRIREHYAQTGVRASVSAGVAVSYGDLSLNDLLKDADEALYQAKSLGRNNVVVATAVMAGERTADRMLTSR